MIEPLSAKTMERIGRCHRDGTELRLTGPDVDAVYQRLRLLAALEQLANEETWDGNEIMSLLNTSTKRKVTTPMVAIMIGHLAAGKTNRLIAADLGISETAVSQLISGKYPNFPQKDQVPALLRRLFSRMSDS
ncbi:MAG: hypothetical protein M0015_02885 [Betaproteobacteria bacterium]|nr:hypothetical protein [Betaproteobacteria bacterium]